MKLPLEATVAGGYSFLFTRIVSIIGTVWLPYLLLFACGGLGLWLVLPHGLWHGDFSQMHPDMMFDPRIQAVRLLFTAAAWVVAAMITAHLMRHALGLKESTTFIHFSLAGPVWRMLGAFVLAVLLLVPVIVVVAVAAVAAGIISATQHLQPMQTAGLMIALVAIVMILFAYVVARLFFFLPAVVVAEKRIGLGRAWQLGRGNVWRIIGVWLCIAVPVWIIIGLAIGTTVFPIIFAILPKMPNNPTPDDMRPLFEALWRIVPIILPIGIAAGIAVRGYMAGAIGTAYKAVTGPQEERA
jgi:hypothetical protein